MSLTTPSKQSAGTQPPRRLSTRVLTMVAAAATLAVPLAAIGRPTPAHAAAVPLSVVAVGDSYASGEGAKNGSWLLESCHRSAVAAPQLANNMLALKHPTTFYSQACSGSVIENGRDGAHQLLNSYDDGGHLVSGQLSQVWGKVDDLTVSIGGNDLNFGGIVTACMNPFSECENDPNVTSPLADNLAALQYSRLPHLIDAIQGSSSARQTTATVRNVYITEYPDPTTAPEGATCGSSNAPTFGGFEGLSGGEANWMRQNFLGALNNLLRGAVNRANDPTLYPGPHPVWHFVTGISNAFIGHGYCAGDGYRWINTPADSLASQGDTDGSMHPNYLPNQAMSGQPAIANALYPNLLLYPKVTSSPKAVVNSPTTLTVRAATLDGLGVAGAAVTIDGTYRGTTDASGVLTLNGVIFSTAGSHTAVVQAASFPKAQKKFLVQGQQYQVIASPSPIPVGTTIPTLTLTARDTATNQVVPGTFTFSVENVGTLTVVSGTPVYNVVVRRGYVWQTDIDPLGKPIRFRVPVCPTLTFQPSRPEFLGGDFSYLLAC